MAKSIRSKIKKRFRTAKRQRVSEMIDRPRNEKTNRMIAKIAEGLPYEKKKPKNAFLYPKDPEAKIPQVCVQKPVDFRSSHLPMAGYAFRGNRRKYTEEEREALLVKSKTHPKMERLAGAPLPDEFRSEEELAAEEAGQLLPAKGLAVTAPSNDAMLVEGTTSAVEPAEKPNAMDLGGEETAQPPAATAEEEEEGEEESAAVPQDGVDTSRKPVKKDLRKAQQAPKKKETMNSVKKKQKQKSAAAKKKGK